jgi:xanthine/CO dehydrogenase XdhC/CoxF family maturation factor
MYGQPFASGADTRHVIEPAPTVAVRAMRLDTNLELMIERSRRHSGERVLATIVATAGSTFRRAGAHMLLMADGNYLGLLSGGCLEADLFDHAKGVLESGAARLVEYDMRSPDDVLFGIGAGCEGAMLVLLERAGSGPSGVGHDLRDHAWLRSNPVDASDAQGAAGHRSRLRGFRDRVCGGCRGAEGAGRPAEASAAAVGTPRPTSSP